MIEKTRICSYVTARLLLHTIIKEVIGHEVAHQNMAATYADYFPGFIKRGVEAELLDERMLQYDLKRLRQHLNAQRDLKFDYLGLCKHCTTATFAPSQNTHRIAASFLAGGDGPGTNEIDREARAIEFYEVLAL